MTTAPYNPDVEAALIGRLLEEPERVTEIAGTLIDKQHFYLPAHSLLFDAIVERFYADEPINPVVLGEIHAKKLASAWGTDERTAVQRVVGLAEKPAGAPAELAKLVKRDFDYRQLVKVARGILESVEAERESPEAIAGYMGEQGLKIATSAVESEREFDGLLDIGRTFYRDTKAAMARKAAGAETGAWFGLRAIDNFTHGMLGGELWICAGEPGVGKSSVIFKAAMNFAERQAMMPRAPGEKPVGALILSLEMSPTPNAARFASMIGGLNGTSIREGIVTEAEIQHAIEEFRRRQDVPLWVNYRPTLKASQLRALVTEAVRRHNTGLVVIDHFRMWDLDERLRDRNDEDEEKVRFLKEQIASPLDVAVICLAHTRKPDPSSNGKPKMSDLRGSYQVAAHSDFVSFVYRPKMYSETNDQGQPYKDTDATLIWAKNRHGNPGEAPFYFAPATMFIAD